MSTIPASQPASQRSCQTHLSINIHKTSHARARASQRLSHDCSNSISATSISHRSLALELQHHTFNEQRTRNAFPLGAAAALPHSPICVSHVSRIDLARIYVIYYILRAFIHYMCMLYLKSPELYNKCTCTMTMRCTSQQRTASA